VCVLPTCVLLGIRPDSVLPVLPAMLRGRRRGMLRSHSLTFRMDEEGSEVEVSQGSWLLAWQCLAEPCLTSGM
jgi:hypothetical protein